MVKLEFALTGMNKSCPKMFKTVSEKIRLFNETKRDIKQ
jgi:hypothetical protein